MKRKQRERERERERERREREIKRTRRQQTCRTTYIYSSTMPNTTVLQNTYTSLMKLKNELIATCNTASYTTPYSSYIIVGTLYTHAAI